MSESPSAEEAALWQRRLASRANNHAWTLAEAASRTAAEDEAMLHAACTAMYLWNAVGNDRNRAHAALLLAHVHALLRNGEDASRYFAKASDAFFSGDADASEQAIAHAVAANVAAANGDDAAHARHYAQAEQRIAALPGEQDRQLLGATLRVVPAPRAPATALDRRDAS